MAQHPTGTVTFLFTDIEGSTKLARQFPYVWPAVQARHHTLLQDAITTHQGYVFRTIGDEFNAAFQTALDALEAALAAQRGLCVEEWGALESIHVRMGLHTGPARLQLDEYEGYLTLSHVKRLMAAAYGGQFLLSEATESLLRDSLPQDIRLRDLGNRAGIAHQIECFGLIAGAQGNACRAALLFGAAEALREAIGSPMTSYERNEYDAGVASLQAITDATSFTSAWEKGRSLAMEGAIAYVLEQQKDE